MMELAKLEKTGVALLASRLCILGDDPCGGSEVVLWEDARILERAGIPARTYCSAARAEASVKILPFRTRRAQLNTIEYSRAILRSEPEALILAYNEPALAGFAPDRTVVRFDWSTPLPRYWSWPFWLPRFQRARYIFPSQSERQKFLEEHSRIPPNRAAVLANSVDLHLFQPTGQPRSRRINGNLRIGFAGQWSAGKGVEPLLAAWRSLRLSLPDVELLVAGGAALWRRHTEAPGTACATSLMAEMHDKKLLHSVGPIPRAQMPGFWNSVDIAVVPSLSESFGLVALEALACGIPVVASAVGGLKEIVVDGECGLLVPPGDVRALSRALRELLADESLRLRLAAGARPRANDFSLERRSPKLLAMLAATAEEASTEVESNSFSFRQDCS